MENHFWSYMIFQTIRSKVFDEDHVEKVFKIPLSDLPLQDKLFEMEIADNEPKSGQLIFLSTMENINAHKLKMTLTSPLGSEYKFPSPQISEVWKGFALLNIDDESLVDGTWMISLQSLNTTEEYIYIINHTLNKRRSEPVPWSARHDEQPVVDGNISLAVPIYAVKKKNEYPDLISRVGIYPPSSSYHTIVNLNDDGLLGMEYLLTNQLTFHCFSS